MVGNEQADQGSGMDAAQLADFLEMIGISGVVRNDIQREVRGRCPFAHWRHQAKQDTQATFCIKFLGKSQTPEFSCSECGSKGDLPDLLRQLQALTGRGYAEANRMLSEVRQPSTRRRILVNAPPPPRHSTPRIVKPLSEEILEGFPLLDGCDLRDAQFVIHWLHHERGISPKVITKHRLRLYIDPLIGDVGVAFPIINPKTGGICELWAWLVGGEHPFRLLVEQRGPLTSSRTSSALFGLDKVCKGDPLVLVQSPIGVMKLESFGVAKTVAVLGYVNRETLHLLHAPNVYLAFDDTLVGRAMAKQVHAHVPSARTYFLRWSNVRKSNGKCLIGPEDLESLAQFKEMFESRIVMGKP